MSGHRINADLGAALQGGAVIKNPGTGGTIELKGRSFGVCRNFGTGTYKFPTVTAKQVGTAVLIVASGTETWTNAAGSTRGILTAGETAIAIAGSTSDWTMSILPAGQAIEINSLSDIPFTYEGAATAIGPLVDAHQVLNGAVFNLVDYWLPVPLFSLRIMSSMAVGTLIITDATPDTGGAGLIGSTTTPILEPINGATTGCQRLNWASSNNTVVGFQVPLPADLDDARDITLSVRIASGGTTNAVGFTVTSYFGETGAAVSDTTATNQTTSYTTCLATIAAADVPSGARTMTVSLAPVAHTSDAMHLSAVDLIIPRIIHAF